MKRCAAVAVVAVATLVAAAGPADAGSSTLLANKVAKHREGPYKQFRRLDVGANGEKVRFEKVKNKTDQPQSVVLDDQVTGAGTYGTRYRAKGQNVTQDVHGAGYQFELPPGGKRIIRVTVLGKGNTSDACLALRAQDEAHTAQSAGFSINVPLFFCLASG